MSLTPFPAADGSPAGIGAIRGGGLRASVAQSPAGIRRIAGEQAYAHLEGEAVEKNTRLPVAPITAENGTIDGPVGFPDPKTTQPETRNQLQR